MIQQDIKNAGKIIETKANKLRDRLKAAHASLKQIEEAGKDMDGNASDPEEEEFVSALADELPDVFSNIERNFKDLDEMDKGLKKLKTSEDPDLVSTLKNQMEKISQHLNEIENLCSKLDFEITEWEPRKKLSKRDKDLDHLEITLKETALELDNMLKQCEAELEKIIDKLEQGDTSE